MLILYLMFIIFVLCWIWIKISLSLSKGKNQASKGYVPPPELVGKYESAKKLAQKIDKSSGKGAAAAALRDKSLGAGGAKLSPAELQKKKAVDDLKKILSELDEETQQIVKLGDASIASPFTSRLSSIQCVAHIIRWDFLMPKYAEIYSYTEHMSGQMFRLYASYCWHNNVISGCE